MAVSWRRGAAPSVGVVGAGTAGLAAGLFLARRGARVRILEKTLQADFEKPAGAGIGLQPIGLTVLKRLRLLEPILSHGHRIDKLKAVTEVGTTVLDLSYGDFRHKLYGVGLHREVLCQSLHEAAKRETNIELTYGFEAERLDIAGADGAVENAVIDRAEVRHGPFDLLIVADGRRSIRTTTSAQAMEYHYPYGCLWAVLPDRSGEFVTQPTLSQVLSSGSAHEMLGFLPCGRTLDMPPDAARLVSIFWSLELASLEKLKARGFDAWRDRALELEPRAADLLQQLCSFEDLIPAACEAAKHRLLSASPSPARAALTPRCIT